MRSIVPKVFLLISAVFGVAVFYILHRYLPSLTGNTASFFLSTAIGFVVFGIANGHTPLEAMAVEAFRGLCLFWTENP
jgi:asparagine N-glycosylation enzyme membrane subunit Stt3